MTNDVRLRPVVAGEATAVEALLRRAFRDYVRGLGRDEPSPMNWLEGRIAEGAVYWVDATGTPAGVVVTSLHEKAVLEINMLGIDPSRQGHGIGRQVLALITAMAREKGVKTLALRTAQPYTRLVALYSRAGFRVVAVDRHPDQIDDIPRVFMELELKKDEEKGSLVPVRSE
ncbi:GNAT family N-acetyltransferase [Flavimaricola sp.]|nr:GNAT family N-acetyltransferase [Flavimaricola sp.]MDA9020112.1 GNAT family N-acetyltransferase [Flavimaricola sp.]